MVRNSDDFVIEALSECIGLPPTVEDFEALACRRTIPFAIKIGLQDVVFEGDFEVIYKHLISDSPWLAAFGHIIEDSRLLTSNLRMLPSHMSSVMVILLRTNLPNWRNSCMNPK